MQSVSSRIWTRVAVFISYDDNNYTTGNENIKDHTMPLLFPKLIIILFYYHLFNNDKYSKYLKIQNSILNRKIYFDSLVFNSISTFSRLFNGKAILLEEQ